MTFISCWSKVKHGWSSLGGSLGQLHSKHRLRYTGPFHLAAWACCSFRICPSSTNLEWWTQSREDWIGCSRARPQSSDTTYAHIPLARTQSHGSTVMQGNPGDVVELRVPEETTCTWWIKEISPQQVCLTQNSSPLESASYATLFFSANLWPERNDQVCLRLNTTLT